MTDMTISEILKHGIAALEAQALDTSANKPYEVYRSLDLGSGGYAIADARQAKSAVTEAIRRKHRR